MLTLACSTPAHATRQCAIRHAHGPLSIVLFVVIIAVVGGLVFALTRRVYSRGGMRAALMGSPILRSEQYEPPVTTTVPAAGPCAGSTTQSTA